MKTLSIILTLNVTAIIFSVIYIANKLNKIQKCSTDICNKIGCLYNKVDGFEDNSNDKLYDLKVDLEKLGRLLK